MAVVRVLRRLRVASGGRVRFLAVPNGGSRGRGEGARLKAGGVVAGVPDILVLGGPPQGPVEPLTAAELASVRQGSAGWPADDLVRRLVATVDARGGFALEMKRAGGRPSDVTPEQRDWLAWFGDALGWGNAVGFGSEDALRKLKAAGYDVRTTVED